MSPSSSSRDSPLPMASYRQRFSMKAAGPPQSSGGAAHFPATQTGAHLSGIGIEKYSTFKAQPLFTAADLKTMQVHIFPAEGDLQYVVKLCDAAVTRHQQPAPNQ